MRVPETSIAMVVVAGLLLTAHLFASAQATVARDTSRSNAERVAAGARARSLEPFNRTFALAETIAMAQSALDAGDPDLAYALLLPYSTSVRGDEVFRATYQRAVDAKWVLDARKAHQQHAKEQEDGALAPEDVFK